MSTFNAYCDSFRDTWERLNVKTGVDEPFPSFVAEIADQIKNFMVPANRKYQGATGNARGMLDALARYVRECTLEDSQVDRFLGSVSAILQFLLCVRLTSQVPLNTEYFLRRHLQLARPSTVEEAKRVLAERVEFHLDDYVATEEAISSHIEKRIIDRVEQYGGEPVVVGTHCHSGVVRRAIVKAKDRIKLVVVDKTEPEQQGVLTAFELLQAGVPVKLINLAQFGIEFRRIGFFLFGVDAVSADGTVLNKTGTRMLATLAKTKDIPVFFLGSTYKYARDTLLGGLVPIEHRQVEEKVFNNHLGIDLSPWYRPDAERRGSDGRPLLTTQFSAFDTTKAAFYDAVVSEVGFLPMREAFQARWGSYLEGDPEWTKYVPAVTKRKEKGVEK
ncbi:MAG: hypothetical protein Kow0069_24000 [Promethearchaeota archaeon]